MLYAFLNKNVLVRALDGGIIKNLIWSLNGDQIVNHPVNADRGELYVPTFCPLMQ